MKILKPGKVEHWKFVCPNCGCVLVADEMDVDGSNRLRCPTCEANLYWVNGEPYEEPTPTQGCIDRLTSMIADLGYVNETVAWNMAVQLIEQGVTFREGCD